eukprot:TRINITY_DN20422_c0_g1_i3.p1 TRINITY_DN20422_c0_g1~~TRINITY_DN20422_c0_g1_i3.p1  ORF type:complete len:810 (-),score=182.14 TRINITY_DN20422_c0_g1_i3:81-2510(-)
MPEDRGRPDVEELLQQLRDDELVTMLTGRGMWEAGGVPRMGVPPLRVSDGPHGMRGCSLTGDAGAPLAPCELALAATFDEQIIGEVGRLIGADCARRGAHVLLGPCLNMQRSPLFGRHFECFSEDPYLTSRAGVAYIRGVQEHVAACAKHFVCNDQETNRHTMNSVIDEEPLQELYLAPFRAAVKEADVESIMCGYNRLNGTYCTESSYLLQKVLREEWGYRGWVVSDWFGNQSTVSSVQAGLNLEMPGIEPRHYGGYLLDAVKAGRVSRALLQERCRPLLRTVLRPPAPERGLGAGRDLPREHAVLRRAAAMSMVLLKNDRQVLPLKKSSLRRIAVIGPNASTTTVQGGGSCRVRPLRCQTILEALKGVDGIELRHAPGCFAGEERRTTAEFEALKVVGSCDPSGQPKFFQVSTRVFDTALSIGGWLMRHEWFRRGVMPVLRLLGVRQSDPVEVAAREHKARAAAEAKGENNLPSGCIGSAAVAAGVAASTCFCGLPAKFAAGALVVCCPLPVVTLKLYNLYLRRLEERMLKAAAEAARDADACVVVLGTDGHWETEGMDMPHMKLPGRQNELVSRIVAAARGPVVVVLNVGSPKELPWIDSVSAVLLAHFGGERMAAAVVDTLFGASCPAGRVPTTWPKHFESSSVASMGGGAPGDTVYTEGLKLGYRRFENAKDAGNKVLFPFGHGLSYTRFTYGTPAATVQSGCGSAAGPTIALKVRVKNEGDCAGAEVVQVYAALPGFPRALCGFARTASLDPGAEEEVTVEVRLGGSARSQSQLRAGARVRLDVAASASPGATIHRSVEVQLK